MTRFTSTSMQAASSASIVAYRILAEIGVTSGSVYACNGNQFIFALGNTYTPVGGLGTVSAIEEETDGFPRDISLKLAAVSSANLYEPLRESMFGRRVTLRRTFLNPDTLSQVQSLQPEVMWTGTIASIEIHMDEDPPIFELVAETTLRRSAKIRQFNNQTLKRIDSSDTMGSLMDQIPGFKSLWGQEETKFNVVTAPPANAHPDWKPSWRTPYRP